jgi:hypothetical protein
VETGAFPRADGRLAVAFLSHGASTLLLGNRDELYYENAERAQLIRRGPPGVGAVVTLLVPKLDAVYEAVRSAQLQILLEPVVEFYGDRVFMFLDPDDRGSCDHLTGSALHLGVARRANTTSAKKALQRKKPEAITVFGGEHSRGRCAFPWRLISRCENARMSGYAVARAESSLRARPAQPYGGMSAAVRLARRPGAAANSRSDHRAYDGSGCRTFR